MTNASGVQTSARSHQVPHSPSVFAASGLTPGQGHGGLAAEALVLADLEFVQRRVVMNNFVYDIGTQQSQPSYLSHQYIE